MTDRGALREHYRRQSWRTKHAPYFGGTCGRCKQFRETKQGLRCKRGVWERVGRHQAACGEWERGDAQDEARSYTGRTAQTVVPTIPPKLDKQAFAERAYTAERVAIARKANKRRNDTRGMLTR